MRKHKKIRLCSLTGIPTENSQDKTFHSQVEISNDSSHVLDSLAGKIESVHMVNFMCHTNLEVGFNKQITFITGRNGSGKSTIMAALIVALGGAASTTGRGSGMTDFIKKGETWAKVTVTLINDGVNPYKRHIYGNRIIITRSLSKNAGSSYTCKAGSGEVISKKKEEVDKICTALDIQIRNPLCILNQDVARSFLSATDDHVKYSLFMKATRLENLKLIYEDTIDILNSSKKQLESKKSGIAEASKEINQLREKLEYFASLEKYMNEKTSLENEYLWSLVISEEKELAEVQEKRKKIEERRQELAERDANYETEIGKLEEQVRSAQEKLSNIGGSQGEERARKKELQGEIQNFQREIDAANSRLKLLLAKSERQMSDINSIREHLKQDEELLSQREDKKREIAERMKKLESDLSELRDRVKMTRRDVDSCNETKVQHTVALDTLKMDLRDLEKSRSARQSELERATSVRQNSLLKFGPFTPKLREMIDQAAKKGMFKKKPVGPCGLYVTLSGDSKWARAVEFVVSGLMNTYCCDNQEDFQVLNQLMEKACMGKHPPVIISKFQGGRHNVSSKKVNVRGLSSVLDVLQFSDDVVFNTFIDQARPETILLFETDAQAASLLTHIQNVPKNLRMGLTLQSDQYYPAPNYRTYCGDAIRPLKFFDAAVKTKAITDRLETDLRKSDLEIKEKKMEIAEVTSQLGKATEVLKKLEVGLRSLKQRERQMELDMKQLKEEEERQPVLLKRVALEEELKILEKSEAETQEKLQKDREAIDALQLQKSEKVKRLEEICSKERESQEVRGKLEGELDDARFRLTREKDRKKNLNGKVREMQIELDKATQEVEVKRKALEGRLKAATEVHPDRIETDRSPVQVHKLWEKCEKYLQATERNLESKEVIIAEYKMKHEKYKQMKETIDVLRKVIDFLTRNAQSKRDRFDTLQSHTANLVSLHFQTCLQTRGYDGQLVFDFNRERLEIEVIPKDGLARKDTKTLSGGERSYSMVSFILAIWRAVEMPFYFLDEFDVFMDKVNRKVIMDLLLDYAKNQFRMQFIFVTPQDTSIVHMSDAVSVYRMPDPRK